MEISEKVAVYYAKEHHFKKGIALLRDLALKTKAAETFKWQTPVYTINGKNVFWISRFKHHFSLGFFNGALLKDPNSILENAQPGKTKAMRHWKFKSLEEIDTSAVLAYMQEALQNQEERLE